MFAGYFKQKRYQDHFHSLPVIIDFSTGLPVDLCFPWKGRETKDPNLNSSSSGCALGCRLSRPVGGTDSGLLSGREETCTASRIFPRRNEQIDRITSGERYQYVDYTKGDGAVR